MPGHDACVLWRLVGVTGEPVTCYAIEGDDGALALTVERRDEIIVAEMMVDLDAAVTRAEVLRAALLAQGTGEA